MFTSLKNFASAAAISAVTAGAAAAQDATDWQGFYGGFQFDIASPEVDGAPVQLGTGHGGSLFVGYNHAIDANWVVGGELSYGQVSGIPIVPGIELDMEDVITLRGRAGYALGNSLIYGSLGYQQADLTILGTTVDADGVVFGLGFETMLTETVSARIEYNRSDLDLDGVPAGIEGNTVSIGVAMHF